MRKQGSPEQADLFIRLTEETQSDLQEKPSAYRRKRKHKEEMAFMQEKRQKVQSTVASYGRNPPTTRS